MAPVTSNNLYLHVRRHLQPVILVMAFTIWFTTRLGNLGKSTCNLPNLTCKWSYKSGCKYLWPPQMLGRFLEIHIANLGHSRWQQVRMTSSFFFFPWNSYCKPWKFMLTTNQDDIILFFFLEINIANLGNSCWKQARMASQKGLKSCRL